jgi:hypothetical protein
LEGYIRPSISLENKTPKRFRSSSAGTKNLSRALSPKQEATVAVNKPKGDNARKGAVKKRTQLKNPLTKTSTKRNKAGGQFLAVKKSAKKFKGVRNEKKAA